MRHRLREILESAHYAVSVGEGEAGGEDEGQHQLDLDKEVINLDYLDEVCISHVNVSKAARLLCGMSKIQG